jgi:hypothetical protein
MARDSFLVDEGMNSAGPAGFDGCDLFMGLVMKCVDGDESIRL